MATHIKKDKILLTGGAGFIGSNIADHYIKEGYEVVIVDNLSTGHQKNIPPSATFYKADICDPQTLQTIFKKEKPTFINHHAAQIDVRTSIENPAKDAEINILGMVHLLECARQFKISKFIYGSTGGALYGESADHKPTETSAIQPLSHYGVSKYCGEHYLKLYAHLYGIQYTVLRYGNVYGPHQNPRGEAGVIAIFTHAMLNNCAITIYGDGKQTRDYCFVGDVVTANRLALAKGEGQTINISSGINTSVNELFAILKELTGYIQEASHLSKRNGEITHSQLNSDLAKKVLSWEVRVSLKDGLKKTVQWQKTAQKI